jgi:hypothetical protein
MPHDIGKHEPPNLIQSIDPSISLAILIGQIQMLEYGIEVEYEMLLDILPERSQYSHPIIIIRQPIREHSPSLVHPQPRQTIHRRDFLLISEADTEDDFGEVA